MACSSPRSPPSPATTAQWEKKVNTADRFDGPDAASDIRPTEQREGTSAAAVEVVVSGISVKPSDTALKTTRWTENGSKVPRQ